MCLNGGVIMLVILKKIIAFIISFIISLTPFAAQPVQKCEPAFSGTFLQIWMSSTWDDERWQTEIAAMKEAGVEYLILQDTAEKSSMLSGGSWTVYYPSSCSAFGGAGVNGDAVEAALRNCSGTGIKIFIGLAMFEDWWYLGAVGSEYKNICELSAQMAEEIYNSYHSRYPDTFYGWYFTPEINNMPPVKLSISSVADGLNIILDKMTSLNADMPLLISPYFTEYISIPAAVSALPMWITFFEKTNLRDGDIFCPQDAIGAKWVDESNLEKLWKMYYQAVESCDRDIHLWANCENFTSSIADSAVDGIFTPSATENTQMVTSTLDRFTWQMKTASYYAENIITFSYNHYFSPALVSDIYQKTYIDYLNNGYELETQAPTAPSELSVRKTDDGISLSWKESTDNFGISYYRILRDGEFLSRVEFNGAAVPTFYLDTDTAGLSGEVTYSVTAYDAAGNSSSSTEAALQY